MCIDKKSKIACVTRELPITIYTLLTVARFKGCGSSIAHRTTRRSDDSVTKRSNFYSDGSRAPTDSLDYIYIYRERMCPRARAKKRSRQSSDHILIMERQDRILYKLPAGEQCANSINHDKQTWQYRSFFHSVSSQISSAQVVASYIRWEHWIFSRSVKCNSQHTGSIQKISKNYRDSIKGDFSIIRIFFNVYTEKRGYHRSNYNYLLCAVLYMIHKHSISTYKRKKNRRYTKIQQNFSCESCAAISSMRFPSALRRWIEKRHQECSRL